MNKNNAYDIIVIGAGSGGLNVASFFARLEMKVLLIDKKEENIGGDCLNTGCVPSKALIHVANTIKAGRDSHRYGTTGSGEVNLRLVMDEIHAKQNYIREHENSEYLKTKGMDVLLGAASFVSEKSVLVNGQEYFFKKCIVATGSRARTLTIDHDDSVRQVNNENIFTLDTLPKHFVFLGGGPIGCELGQAFVRLGSTVTILNADQRILPREDASVSSILEKQFKEDGITIINNAKIEKIREGFIFYKVGDEQKSAQADTLFVGIGRVLNIEGLDLEKGGVTLDEKKQKLLIDDRLRTANKNIYTVGDVAGSFMFTHAAEEHARVVINNILSPFKKKSPKTLAWVTYTTPEVATFGKSEADLQKEGAKYETLQVSFEDEDRAITDDAQEGFVRVYLDTKGHILGGTTVGESAGELNQELLLLHYNKLPIDKLFDKVYPYPSLSRVNKRLVMLYMSKRLTSGGKRLLKVLFSIFN